MPSYFITHPEVEVDPHAPIGEWNLSAVGRDRAAHLTSFRWTNELGRIITSTEQKAKQTGEILAGPSELAFTTDARLRENDRSSTGFLPPIEFEATANQFFARPNVSIRGWETAAQAQRRIVSAIRQLSSGTTVSTAFVAHGAVGTLLLCNLMGRPISREHDQPGQGSYFEFDPQSWTASHSWRRIEPGSM
ncbi:MAG: histidine phosphatase family protein [Specibacter sp.]